MNILYEDNALVVLDKPAGLSSEEGVPATLRQHWDTPDAFVGVVHRLDTGVSGLMVFARTPAAAAALSRQVTQSQEAYAVQDGRAEGRAEVPCFVKQYRAVLSGGPNDALPAAGTLRDWLFKDSRRGRVFPVSRPRKGVREAVLEYRIVRQTQDACLAEITLHTGRTHQIRVQFASRKHPLWGDGKYGSRVKGAIALQSCGLQFVHPDTGRIMNFTLPLPDTAPWNLFAERCRTLVKTMEQYKTDAEIYAVLEREIIDLTIRPGSPLSENPLCARFGAPRTLIRMVLQRLKESGLVRIVPYKGTTVTRLNRRIVDELIYERTAVEAKVLRDFTPKCTPEQRALIRVRVDAYEALARAEAPDYNKLYEADRLLHETWFAAMDKMYLWSTLQNAHADYSRFRMLDTMTTGGLDEVIADHRNLLNAIERCDLAAFEPLVERHLYGGIRRLGSKLTGEYADYFEPETQK